MPNLFQDSTNIYNYSHENTESSSKIEKDDIKSYSRGQVICGKVGKYPWWPCMVAVDKNGSSFKENGLLFHFKVKNILFIALKQIVNLKYWFHILGKVGNTVT